MSAYTNTDRLKQLSFESVFRRFGSEIRTQPARLKNTVQKPVPALATVLESEDVTRADNLALHTTDFANPFDTTDAISHTLDLHDKIDSAGNLCPQCPQRQVRSGHQHHIFKPEQRVTRSIGVDR